MVRLVKTLQEHILELVSQFHTSISPEKANQYSEIISRLQSHEQHKYLEPNFSQYMQPLYDQLLGKNFSNPELQSELAEERVNSNANTHLNAKVLIEEEKLLKKYPSNDR